MPLKLIRQDITKLKVDAVVNAANSSLLGGGGVDGAIHRAAGRKLFEECSKLHGCETGKAKITGGYNMPCKYIIHTVGPVWNGGSSNEEALLYSCYKESLDLAESHHCESVAFPLISSGIYGYPKDEALNVATRAITDFLNNRETDILVYICIFDKASFEISSKLFDGIEQYIDNNYVCRAEAAERRESGAKLHGLLPGKKVGAKAEKAPSFNKIPKSTEEDEPVDACYMPCFEKQAKGFDACFSMPCFNEKFELDESFSSMVIRKIDEKGISDPECYKKANMDRRLFSKIRSDDKYKPSKSTALALAVALCLSLEETQELLSKAGFTLSQSVLSDVIIKYCIVNKEYNIFRINEILFSYDQPLL